MPTTKYPTPAEIMAQPILIPKETIAIMMTWRTTWQLANKQKKRIQLELLKLMIAKLAKSYGQRQPTVIFNQHASTASYNRANNIITLNNLSIISALHEFGHLLYGHSELQACCFSVHLFKATFPLAFQKLHWEGHLLKK